MIEIRTITLLDVERLVSLGRVMAAESPRAVGLGYDDNRARRFAQAAIDSPLFACIGAFDGDDLAGFLIAMVGEIFPFSSAVVAHEEFLFVDQKHRGGRVAIRLVDAFIDVARARGAVQIEMRNATGYRPEAVERFYQSRGLRRVGALFVMEV